MELKKFEKLLKENNALRFDRDILVFNDLELFSVENNKSKKFKDYEEFYNYKLNETKIKDIILSKKEFYLYFDGGRGASSLNGKMGGGFTSASDNGNKRVEPEPKYPAEFNAQAGGRFKSYDKTLKLFVKKYKNSDVEYGITIDEQGFVHRHVKGGSTSVAIGGVKNEMLVHNHPSGGNFSKQDLVSIASGPEKGIVAVGDRNYTLTKTKRFKSKEFIKGVSKAKWPVKYDYDKGADWWLRKNADKYGYKYTAKK